MNSPFELANSTWRLTRAAVLAVSTVALLLVIAAAPASAAPGALKLGVLAATCTGGGEGPAPFENFKSQLTAEPGVAAADTLEYGADTATSPAVPDLSSYDGLAVMSWCRWKDPVALGNALADFQDAGGVVVAFSWNFWSVDDDAGYAIQGRWEGDHSPLVHNQVYPELVRELTDINSPSPILSGVTKLGAETTYNTTLSAGAESILDWVPGQSAIAVKGRAVAANALPAGSYFVADHQFGRVTVNSVKSLGRQLLTVTRTGNGRGAVTSTPAGIDCGAICTAAISSGTNVSLRAKAAKGSAFTGWSGACSGRGACTFLLAAPGADVSATFASVKLGKTSINKRKLKIRVPGAGKLVISAPGITKRTLKPKKAGNISVTLKPDKKLKRKLKSKGSAKLKFKFAYTPTGAAKATTTKKTLKLKR